MADRNDATIETSGMEQNAVKRRRWHAPAFSMLDVEATDAGAASAVSDSGSNHMS